jgi:steroid 5-alpha reductase family enzyme
MVRPPRPAVSGAPDGDLQAMSDSPERPSIGRPISRLNSLALVGAFYALALALGALAWVFGPFESVLARAFFADVVATLVVFGGSVAFNNSSMYDPYWSVIPPALWLGWQLEQGEMTLRGGIVGILVFAWAVRLTLNWARGWTGLTHEDWRYTDFRPHGAMAYWGVSLAGFHLFPTLLVFLGCLSVELAGRPDAPSVGFIDLIAFAVTTMAIVVETVADEQLKAFVASKPPRTAFLKSGLWAFSRHPNYFGELSFWWGLWLFGFAAHPGAWWTLAGPLSMVALFVGVSVPMIDARMRKRRPDYAEHEKKVNAIVPWFPRG